MNQRLIHDASVACATRLVEIFANLLREEEKRDAWQECYVTVKAGIEAFVIQHNRELQRLKPGRN